MTIQPDIDDIDHRVRAVKELIGAAMLRWANKPREMIDSISETLMALPTGDLKALTEYVRSLALAYDRVEAIAAIAELIQFNPEFDVTELTEMSRHLFTINRTATQDPTDFDTRVPIEAIAAAMAPLTPCMAFGYTPTYLNDRNLTLLMRHTFQGGAILIHDSIHALTARVGADSATEMVTRFPARQMDPSSVANRFISAAGLVSSGVAISVALETS